MNISLKEKLVVKKAYYKDDNLVITFNTGIEIIKYFDELKWVGVEVLFDIVIFSNTYKIFNFIDTIPKEKHYGTTDPIIVKINNIFHREAIQNKEKYIIDDKIIYDTDKFLIDNDGIHNEYLYELTKPPQYLYVKKINKNNVIDFTKLNNAIYINENLIKLDINGEELYMYPEWKPLLMEYRFTYISDNTTNMIYDRIPIIKYEHDGLMEYVNGYTDNPIYYDICKKIVCNNILIGNGVDAINLKSGDILYKNGKMLI